MPKTSTFPRSLKKAGAVALTPVLTAGALLVGASPAHAATTRCSAYQFQTAPSVTNVAMKTCVVKNGTARYAYVLIEQARTSGGRTWDKFHVTARLERNDANIAVKNCDFTEDMNNYLSPRLKCTTATVRSSATGGWTGDGIIVFNFNLDGLGDKSRALTGSPKVS